MSIRLARRGAADWMRLLPPALLGRSARQGRRKRRRRRTRGSVGGGSSGDCSPAPAGWRAPPAWAAAAERHGGDEPGGPWARRSPNAGRSATRPWHRWRLKSGERRALCPAGESGGDRGAGNGWGVCPPKGSRRGGSAKKPRVKKKKAARKKERKKAGGSRSCDKGRRSHTREKPEPGNRGWGLRSGCGGCKRRSPTGDGGTAAAGKEASKRRPRGGRGRSLGCYGGSRRERSDVQSLCFCARGELAIRSWGRWCCIGGGGVGGGSPWWGCGKPPDLKSKPSISQAPVKRWMRICAGDANPVGGLKHATLG